MKDLKLKLETLSVLRGLLSDTVITSLLSFFDDPTASNYAEFVSRLYMANGGNLSEYVREILSNSENVYVQRVGAGECVPNFMIDALTAELSALQEVAEQSGYADYKHFSVEFKRIKGCSPSDYRYHFWD